MSTVSTMQVLRVHNIENTEIAMPKVRCKSSSIGVKPVMGTVSSKRECGECQQSISLQNAFLHSRHPWLCDTKASWILPFIRGSWRRRQRDSIVRFVDKRCFLLVSKVLRRRFPVDSPY